MNAGMARPTMVRRIPDPIDLISAPFGSVTCRAVLGVLGTMFVSADLSLSLTMISVQPESDIAGTDFLVMFAFLVELFLVFLSFVGIAKFESCFNWFDLLTFTILQDLNLTNSPNSYLRLPLAPPAVSLR